MIKRKNFLVLKIYQKKIIKCSGIDTGKNTGDKTVYDSDIDVSSIEGAIKILNDTNEGTIYFANEKDSTKIAQAIETVLKDREMYINLYNKVLTDLVKSEHDNKIKNNNDLELLNKGWEDKIKNKIKELKEKSSRIHSEFIKTNRTDKKLHDEGFATDIMVIAYEELLEESK